MCSNENLGPCYDNFGKADMMTLHGFTGVHFVVRINLKFIGFNALGFFNPWLEMARRIRPLQ